MDIDTTACLLRKKEPQFPLKTAKTLPRRSCHMKNESDEFISTIPLRAEGNEHDLVIPPLQNAPRPTTLPTRGAANRLRKAELGLLKDGGHMDVNSNPAFNNRFVGDNISPCESPSYVTNTSYKFPEQPSMNTGNKEEDANALPVLPPKEGKKHIQANPKRHVRKYPLIIPANGVQRTLNRVIGEEDKSSLLKTNSTTNSSTRNLSTVKPFNINNNNMAEYENTTKLQSNSVTTSCSMKEERTYQNIGADDTASLQFESILEADSNKDQVLQSPDVTDGFYNFSIQKDHYHKSKEVDFDAQKLASGLYVNEDELRNLDIDKNMAKLNKQNVDNKKSNESLEAKAPIVDEKSKVLELPKPIEITEETFDQVPSTVTIPSPEILMKSSTPPLAATTVQTVVTVTTATVTTKPLKADNELAGNALFKKVRESVDKAMIKPTDGAEGKRDLAKPLTEAEMFSAAVNRLNDCNSVSCEDLLEFSDKKPKGHERGVDSDEVRIMMKVLGKDVS